MARGIRSPREKKISDMFKDSGVKALCIMMLLAGMAMTVVVVIGSNR